MSGQTTLSTINSWFKYVQDKAESLLPENAVLSNLIPDLTEAQKEGQSYNLPIQLTFENGVTWADGTVYALNPASSAVYQNVQVISYPVILLTQISEGVAGRMANSKQTFITEASLRADVMYNSLARFYEIDYLYGGAGGSGLGTTSTTSSGSGTTATIYITTASWAPGIWSGSVGGTVQFYNGASQVAGSGGANSADSQFVITTVTNQLATSATLPSFTVTGTASGITALNTAITANALTVFWNGQYTNSMVGLDYQITAASNSLSCFGVSGATYPLWAGNIYNCGSTSLTMSKVLAGASQAVAVGGLNSEAILMVSAATYANLNADLSALRQYDQSYDGKEADNGTEGITYRGPNGKIRIVVNNIVKYGDAHLFPLKYVKRVGVHDITFKRTGQNDEFFQEIPGYAGYSLRAGGDVCVFLERPAQAVKFTNIVNS